MQWQKAFRECLRLDFELCRRKNPRYSMRRHGEILGLSSGAFSEVVSGKRKLSLAKALGIARRLKIPLRKRSHLLALMGAPEPARFVRPRAEYLASYLDWISFAIIGLHELDREVDSAFIARKLGVPASLIEAKIEHLLKKKILFRDPSGRLRKISEHWAVSGGGEAVKRRLRLHNLEVASMAAKHLKGSSSIFLTAHFAGNVSQIGVFSVKLQQLAKECFALAEGEPKEDLIQFSAQMFPFDFTGASQAEE